MTPNLKTVTAENAELRARVEALEAKLNPPAHAPKRTVEQEGTRVYRPKASSSFIMPSSADLRRLMEVVLKHSQSGPQPGLEEKFFNQFRLAFMALGEVGRQTEINQEYGIAHWLNMARDICRAQGWSPDFEFRAFWSAVLGHGDIPFQDRNETLGIVPALGLANYGGTPAGDAWRAVLEHDAPPPSTKTFREKFPNQRTIIHVQKETQT